MESDKQFIVSKPVSSREVMITFNVVIPFYKRVVIYSLIIAQLIIDSLQNKLIHSCITRV